MEMSRKGNILSSGYNGFWKNVDKLLDFDRISTMSLAEVAELADALRSGRSEH